MEKNRMSTNDIVRILGGAKVVGSPIRSEMDRYRLGKTGLPKKALLSLAARIDLSLKVIAGLVNITERTIQRKKDLDHLSKPVSEQLLQLAEAFSRGEEVFGSLDRMKQWLTAPNKALDDTPPFDFLSSRFGIQMVLDELGRIEHGVIS